MMTTRNILFLVTGMTPQIITETVWALACDPENQEKWVPDEIHVLSTQDGLNQIKKRLFEDGVFTKFVNDYPQLQHMKFDQSFLLAISDAEHSLLVDLKTPKENELAANSICSEIRKFTQNENISLHVSIAGGRKTMGFYAGYALSLYGRAQDRMSHVLVEEKYEKAVDFFYVTPETSLVSDREKKVIGDAKDANIWLADIPFVRLRDSLAPHNLVSQATFSEVIDSINLAQQPLSVTVDVKKRTVSIGKVSCKLPPRGFALYYWFVLRAYHNLPAYRRPVENEYRPIFDLWELWKGEESIDPMDKKSGCLTLENFEQGLNDIKKNFAKTFGHSVLPKINICNETDGDFLPLQPNQIEIIGG